MDVLSDQNDSAEGFYAAQTMFWAKLSSDFVRLNFEHRNAAGNELFW